MARILGFLRDISVSWVSLSIGIVMAIAVLRVEQIQELLIAATEARWSISLWLVVSVTVAAFCAWYFPRALLYADYDGCGVDSNGQRRTLTKTEMRLPRVLAALIILPISYFYLTNDLVPYGIGFLALAIAVVSLTVLRSWFFPSLKDRRKHGGLPPNTTKILWLILLLTVFLSLAFAVSHVWLPTKLGAAAIIYAAIACWIAFGSYFLVHWSRLAGVSLVFALALLVYTFGFIPDNHEVRSCDQTSDGRGASARCESPVDNRERLVFTDHFSAWLGHRAEHINSLDADTHKYPIFVVVAEGGGIRAAYWTAAVLSNLQDRYPQFFCHVFAISGVSGSSLGGSVFAAQVADRVSTMSPHSVCSSPEPPNMVEFVEQTKVILGIDTLGPLTAGLLFSDVLKRVLPVFWTADRATFIEESWEHAWASTGTDRFAHSFQSLWSDDRQLVVPSLYLNTTIVETGERAVSSNIRVGRYGSLEQIVDLDDLSEVAMPLSAAIHMSARFPYLSPAGKLIVDNEDVYVVDGGYYDNTGTVTAGEIVDAIVDHLRSLPDDEASRFEVAVISIDSAEESGGRLWHSLSTNVVTREIFAPPWTLSSTRSQRERTAKTVLAERPDIDCYVSVLPWEVGQEVRKPLPFAWSLSKSTSDKIDDLASDHPDYPQIGAILTSSHTPPRSGCRDSVER